MSCSKILLNSEAYMEDSVRSSCMTVRPQKLPGYVCVSLLLKVELAVERQQQRSCLEGQVPLLVIAIHSCQQVLCHCCMNTEKK